MDQTERRRVDEQLDADRHRGYGWLIVCRERRVLGEK